MTGHTGFKGGWLALWLHSLCAEVHGYALPPATDPNLFQVANIGEYMASSTLGDIRDAECLKKALQSACPEIILHLAAQPLVGEGYKHPVDTYATNVMGTVHLLEAARASRSIRAIVVVTTDKCYENRESPTGYRENDPLGGADPYSNSKACAELVTSAYRQSYFSTPDAPHIASARAGNVIGGGDWSPDRLVPDILRAFADHQPARLRRPQALRPWQHVLEPLAGYLILAETLYRAPYVAHAWNFGPSESDCISVSAVADLLASQWAHGACWEAEASDFPHETSLLRLDATQAREALGWHSRWNLSTALRATVDWHRAWLAGQDMRDFTLEQIRQYQSI